MASNYDVSDAKKPCKGILKTSSSFDRPSLMKYIIEFVFINFQRKRMNHNLVYFFFLPFAAIAKVPNSTRSMCCRRSIRPTRTMGTWKSMNQRRPIGCRTMPARTVWINWTPRCWLKSEIAEPHWNMMYFNAILFVFIINYTQIAQCYCPIVVQRLRRESGWGNRRRTRWATHFTNAIF